MSLDGNKYVTATVRRGGKIVFGKREKVKIKGLTHKIKELIKR